MHPVIQNITAFVIGGIFAYLTIPVIVKLSVIKKLVDVPNERKVNKTPIPNLGGIALFIGVTMGTLLVIHNNVFTDLRFVLAGMIIMFFVGVKDDILALSAWKKLVAQIFCALVLTGYGDIRITSLHGLIGIEEIGYIQSLAISSLLIVAIINAFNLIDGIDGLAAAIGIIASTFLGILFFSLQHYNYASLSFSLAGSLVAFFFFNVFGQKNKIFMGDTGSLILGLLLAVFTIKYNEFTLDGNRDFYYLAPVLSLAIISVPLFDMIRLFIVRIINNKSPFAPDINHIHHKVLKLGYSHLNATLLICSVNLIIIAVVLVLSSLENNVLLLILSLVAAFFSALPRLIYEYRRANNSLTRKLQLYMFFMPFRKFSIHDGSNDSKTQTKK